RNAAAADDVPVVVADIPKVERDRIMMDPHDRQCRFPACEHREIVDRDFHPNGIDIEVGIAALAEEAGLAAEFREGAGLEILAGRVAGYQPHVLRLFQAKIGDIDDHHLGAAIPLQHDGRAKADDAGTEHDGRLAGRRIEVPGRARADHKRLEQHRGLHRYVVVDLQDTVANLTLRNADELGKAADGGHPLRVAQRLPLIGKDMVAKFQVGDVLADLDNFADRFMAEFMIFPDHLIIPAALVSRYVGTAHTRQYVADDDVIVPTGGIGEINQVHAARSPEDGSLVRVLSHADSS